VSAVRGGILALLLAACNTTPPAAEPPAPPAPPVVDAARPVDRSPPDAAPRDAEVDAAPADGGGSVADAAPPAPDGGSTGFRIVAGAAVVEVDPAVRPEERPRRVPRRAPTSAAPASVAAAPAPVVPSVARVAPMQTIRAHQSDIHNCYGRVALRDPTVAGRITVQWTIGRDGMPVAVAITEDTLKDKSVGACIKEKARTWQFAPPGSGVQVISYPYDLRVQ